MTGVQTCALPISKFPGLEYLKHRLRAKKATTRLKVNTLRVKWL